jgi:hypothetical protein
MWYDDAVSSVYSFVKAYTISKYKTKYPNFKVTDDDAELAKAQLPCVYIHAKMRENNGGKDLENKTINSIEFAFTVNVLVQSDMLLARKIAQTVTEAFKEKRFTANELPEFRGNTVDVKRLIMRYTRTIDENDVI